MPYSDPNIKAEVICDSINQHGDRLTTMVCTYPRIILAEVNTHRMLSRSTASSRAIPVSKQVQKVRENPFLPSWWGANQKGMQAAQELRGEPLSEAIYSWKLASRSACELAEILESEGIHKQITNRLLEPFGYVTSIITATDWANVFKLRAHAEAQPEFMVLAFRALEAYVESEPVRRDEHIPFGDQMEPGLFEEDRIKVACARCARISYETHDGNRDPKDDIRLYDQLVKSGHMSPLEHVAKAFPQSVYIGNFKGWVQHRKTIPLENIQNIDYEALLKTKPEWI